MSGALVLLAALAMRLASWAYARPWLALTTCIALLSFVVLWTAPDGGERKRS